MKTLNYDLHLHSCLSPCGDNDMTPANIVGMAKLKGLDVIAVTDHNSCRNCAPTMQLGEEKGVLVLPGMELTTQEEVHVVCLFSNLADALAFDRYVYRRLIKVENNIAIFGQQLIVDKEEQILQYEPYLLINATEIPFCQVHSLMQEFHGVMIPAHIDKSSNSLLSNLGFVPADSQFTCIEVKDLGNLHEIQRKNPYIQHCNVISDSDAHYLYDINEPIHHIYAEPTRNGVLHALSTYME